MTYLLGFIVIVENTDMCIISLTFGQQICTVCVPDMCTNGHIHLDLWTFDPKILRARLLAQYVCDQKFGEISLAVFSKIDHQLEDWLSNSVGLQKWRCGDDSTRRLYSEAKASVPGGVSDKLGEW